VIRVIDAKTPAGVRTFDIHDDHLDLPTGCAARPAARSATPPAAAQSAPKDARLAVDAFLAGAETAGDSQKKGRKRRNERTPR
jgi:hypothetical protein